MKQTSYYYYYYYTSNELKRLKEHIIKNRNLKKIFTQTSPTVNKLKLHTRNIIYYIYITVQISLLMPLPPSEDLTAVPNIVENAT